MLVVIFCLHAYLMVVTILLYQTQWYKYMNVCSFNNVIIVLTQEIGPFENNV